MNKNLVLFTLDGCNYCAKVKQLLDQDRTKYNHVKCEDSPESCDEIEKLTGVYRYPILKVSQSSKTYFLFMTSKYEDLELISLHEKLYKKGFMSEQDLVNYLKNI